jgi:beta-glucosidase-like glycosyl hydrolase
MWRWLALAAVLALAAAKTVPVSNATLATRACRPGFDTFAFCDTTRSIQERVDDLISRLTDDEITPQLTARHHGGGNPGPESNVTRLGIPTYDWGMNAIHGVQSSCVLDHGVTRCPTSLANPVNFGCAWNASLARTMGAIIATETRALWLAGATEESTWSGLPVIGLDAWRCASAAERRWTCVGEWFSGKGSASTYASAVCLVPLPLLSPNINIARDPRWGRNQEVPSEDPLLNGDYGAAYTAGIQQGEDPRYVKVAVTLKHWDAYSL